MHPLLLTTIIILSLLLLAFSFTYFTYVITFRRRKRPINIERDLGIKIDEYSEILRMGEELRKVPYEEIKIKSHDGLTLVGRYYHTNDKAPVDILFHGVLAQPHRRSDSFVARVALKGFPVLAEHQVSVHRDLACREIQTKNFDWQRKIIFHRVALWISVVLHTASPQSFFIPPSL